MELGFKVDDDADEAVFRLFKQGKITLAWNPEKHDFIVTIRESGYE